MQEGFEMASVNIVVPLTAAEVAGLAAGQPLTLTLTPPAPAVVTPPAPTAPVLKVVCAQNGQLNPTWTQDYSYSAVATHPWTAQAGNGNLACIKVATTGPWGGFQPSNAPGGSTNFSACSTLTVDVWGPKGNSYSMQFLRAGDMPINAPGFLFTKTVDGWERFSCPKSQLMTDAKLGDVSGAIYKGAVQSKLSGTETFYVDNWGGL
jgi:hypothetical protein